MDGNPLDVVAIKAEVKSELEENNAESFDDATKLLKVDKEEEEIDVESVTEPQNVVLKIEDLDEPAFIQKDLLALKEREKLLLCTGKPKDFPGASVGSTTGNYGLFNVQL